MAMHTCGEKMSYESDLTSDSEDRLREFRASGLVTDDNDQQFWADNESESAVSVRTTTLRRLSRRQRNKKLHRLRKEIWSPARWQKATVGSSTSEDERGDRRGKLKSVHSRRHARLGHHALKHTHAPSSTFNH